MRRPKPATGETTRRGFLLSAGAGGVAALSPKALASSEPLYRDVARRARRLAGGRGQLRQLVPHGFAANVRPVAESFHQLTGVEVALQELPVNEITTQMTLDALAGEGRYDLALPATFGIPDLAAEGAIRQISDLAARHEPPGFRDGVLCATGDSFDGALYGFQADGDVYLMYYQRDWLGDPDAAAAYADRYGEPLGIPRSWEDLDRQMAFFHRPDQGRFGGALQRTPDALAAEWWLRFQAKGVWPLSEQLEPQIAGEAGVLALEEMIRAGAWQHPRAGTADLFENWRHFSGGDIYCNMAWGGMQKRLNRLGATLQGRILHAPTPGGVIHGRPVAMSAFNWGKTYVVSTRSRRAELAYLFALFASTAEMSSMAVRQRGGYFDPFRIEHFSDPEINAVYSPEFLDVHRAALSNAIPDLYLARRQEFFQVLNDALGAALSGRIDPEAALRRAATQWSLINLRVGRERQLTRWQALRRRYPAPIRDALRDL